MSVVAFQDRWWTFDDLADLDDGGKDTGFEVVDGRLWPMSRPTSRHDLVCRRLQLQLDRQLPLGWLSLVGAGLRLGPTAGCPT